jgi:uncharacterized protein (TIGR01777 family)
MIGKYLSARLAEKGYEIVLLTRKINPHIPYKQFEWDISEKKVDHAAFDDISYIVNLAGANISDKRWTKTQKSEIESSRVDSTNLLFSSLSLGRHKLKAIVATSAIGYYGSFTSEEILHEIDGPGNDFLAGVCIKWEKAINKFAESGIRTVIIRTGVVLDRNGGAYAKIAGTVQKGMVSALGNGNQYVPWIHHEDLANIFIKALEEAKMKGTYNGVAPEHITNYEFTSIIASSLQKKLRLPNVPSFVVRALFGEMSDILLKGSRVSSQKLIESGFSFKFPELKSALIDLAKA